MEKYDIIVMCVIARIWLFAETVRQPLKQENNIRILIKRSVEMKINYVGNQGDFTMENPEMLSYLYFPIANESGVMSSVAPDLAGDSKMSQNSFLMPPVSCENLHNDKSSRNVWCLSLIHI